MSVNLPSRPAGFRPPAAAYDAVLLDVMGTLVTEPYPDRQTAFLGLSLEELLERKNPEAWLAFERGEIDEAEYFRRFFRDSSTVDGPGLRSAMIAGYGWIDGVEPLVAALAGSDVPLFALSNYPPWYRHVDRVTGLSRYLDWRFVSCRTGVRKPDDQAYLGVVHDLGTEPSRCLFVDDRPVNVDAATRLGLDAVLFQSAEALVGELENRGFLAYPPRDEPQSLR